jgi:REP element-mobilizing transposase RayT
MPQSLSRILVHLIFSSKGRVPFLKDAALRKDLDAYIAGILRECESPLAVVRSTEDHVHALFSLSKNIAACKVIEEAKKSSSKWVKSKKPDLQDFQW